MPGLTSQPAGNIDTGAGIGDADRLVASLSQAKAIAELSVSPDPGGQFAAARLPSDARAVHAGVKVAIAFARDAGFGDEASWKVVMMVEEWLQNVVEHGAPAPGTRIALRLEQLPGLVRVTISDAGQAFDPRPVEFHGPNAERGGGAGLAMIKAWSQLGYSHRGGRNRLVMEMPLT